MLIHHSTPPAPPQKNSQGSHSLCVTPYKDDSCDAICLFTPALASVHSFVHSSVHSFVHSSLHSLCASPRKLVQLYKRTRVNVGSAKTIYILCIYGIFGREVTKYTVIYGVLIRFWPTLVICVIASDKRALSYTFILSEAAGASTRTNPHHLLLIVFLFLCSCSCVPAPAHCVPAHCVPILLIVFLFLCSCSCSLCSCSNLSDLISYAAHSFSGTGS